VSALVWKGNIDDNGTVAEVDEDGEVMIRYGLCGRTKPVKKEAETALRLAFLAAVKVYRELVATQPATSVH